MQTFLRRRDLIGDLDFSNQTPLITNPENLERALRGETGTRIVP